jgi:pseudolysin
VVYDQYYAGVLVWPSQVAYHKGTRELVNGNLIENIAVDLKSVAPKISLEEIKQVALNDSMSAGVKKGTVRFARLIVYAPTHLESQNETTAKLAYLVTLMGMDAQDHLTSPHYVLDANTGAMLNKYEGLHTAISNIGTGPGGNNVVVDSDPFRTTNKYFYGAGGTPLFGKIRLTQNSTNCVMKNEYVELRSWNNNPFEDSSFPLLKEDEAEHPVFSFACANNANDGGFSPINDSFSPNNDTMYFATQTFNMLAQFNMVPNVKLFFGAPGYNAKVLLIPHLPEYDNAFAMSPRQDDGTYDRSFFPQFAAGNGDEEFTANTDSLTISHELGHLVTATGSNLVYEFQSGGINEAYSDIQGIGLNAYLHQLYPWYVYNWENSPEVSKENPPKPLRYFYKPSLDGRSIDNAQQYRTSLNVHLSSGVYNRAFYIFTNLLAGNDLPGLNSPPSAPNDAAILRGLKYFTYANYHSYWLRDSTFNQGACGVMQAALDYKDNGAFIAAKRAFEAVGVKCKV